MTFERARSKRAAPTRCAPAAAFLSALLSPLSAVALESNPPYPIGVDTLYAAAYPPVTGLLLNTYSLYYSADTFKDVNGNETLADFDLDIAVQAFRVVGTWDAEILGARPISYLILPGFHMDGALSPVAGLNFEDERFAVGDISFGQLLQWTSGPWSLTAGAEIYAPTGSYKEDRTFNVGTNVWTFYPQVAATYMDASNNHASLKLQYGFQTENDATGYQNGQHAIIEAAVGIGATQQLGLDLAGFALLQTTDDEIAGARDPAKGGRTRLFGIGPQLRYNFNGGALTAKWQTEFGARNTAEGNRFWFQLGIPLSVKAPTADPIDIPG
ncbi:hypothetical protein ASG43_14855 [Aureimonas sp. Leaf454]|uniref:SphA family protein n=1 Tax=Aureimonas sp. Leaf454 TaxID=1736381 RepID=UPI0007003D14|nr:transporter [Aureimonas sp. Leaf454]KQT44594.1 hypothetical protein ASG43_14855 [Aureimonas sp. Leaf454]